MFQNNESKRKKEISGTITLVTKEQRNEKKKEKKTIFKQRKSRNKNQCFKDFTKCLGNPFFTLFIFSQIAFNLRSFF